MPETTTTAPLADLARMHEFNETLLERTTEGFEATDWTHRAGEANHALWILGHLACTRLWELRNLAGRSVDEQGWEEHFAMGSTPGGEGDRVSPDTLVQAYKDAGSQLTAWLDTLDAEAAAAEVEPEFPTADRSLAGGVRFLYMHECYHLGQLGLLRRVRGKPGIA